jgi:hypothetical protein
MSCGECIETGDRRRGGGDGAQRSGIGLDKLSVNKDGKRISMDVTGIISELRSERTDIDREILFLERVNRPNNETADVEVSFTPTTV